MKITGECFCGSITYKINGKLKNATSCHCSRCRKAFNAQASAAAFVEHTDFQWTSGQELLTTYTGKQGYGVQFCSICGSTLCTVYNEDVLQVTLGCLNDEPELEPIKHIFVASKANWEVLPENVIQFNEWPPQGD